jgi:hypothetical protein
VRITDSLHGSLNKSGGSSPNRRNPNVISTPNWPLAFAWFSMKFSFPRKKESEMKKLFMATAALILATPASADPQVGDWVLYQVTALNVQAASYIKLLKHDKEHGRFLEHTEMTLLNRKKPPKKRDNWMAESKFPTDEQIDTEFENCKQNNGKLETVKVPAGTYEVCTRRNDTGCPGSNCISSIGRVPFGIVRLAYKTPTGTDVVMELKSVSK